MTTPLPISLALAGGGLSGALYDFGAVCGLEAGLPNWRAVRSERIVGTSAGAVVGAILAFGLDPAQISGDFQNKSGGLLRFRRRDFYSIPWRERGAVLSGAFTNSGLERFVERAASMAGCPDRFESLKVPLFIPATDLDTGERVVFGSGGTDLPSVSRAVRASSAIPATFRPVEIGDRSFIDGQLLDPLHLDLTVGPQTRAVFAVSSLVPYRWPGRGQRVAAMHFPAILDQASRVSAVAKLMPSVASFKARHPKVGLFMVEPKPEDVAILLTTGFGRTSLRQAWELGVRAAGRVLEEQRHELESLVGPVNSDAPAPLS